MNQPDPTLPPPTNHVFVDLENIKTIDPAVIGGKRVGFHIFLGPQQLKLDVALVEKLLAHAPSVQLVRSTLGGKNALDFVLAFHLGQAALADPKGHFHIVSKDKGFDALIEHLKANHIRANRHPDFESLTFSGPTKPSVPKVEAAVAPKAAAKPLVQKVVEYLNKSAVNRPKTVKTLLNVVRPLIGKDATDEAAKELIEALRDKGHLTMDDKGKVAYTLKGV